MIKWIHRTSTILVFAIGVFRTVRAFFIYDNLAEPAIWFAGAELGGVFVAYSAHVFVVQ